MRSVVRTKSNIESSSHRYDVDLLAEKGGGQNAFKISRDIIVGELVFWWGTSSLVH